MLILILALPVGHGKCEFDERNIINLKGYNDSGKSAMLNALKVALCNANPTKQVGFIQDDKDYFRVLVTFSDGVQILRDNYGEDNVLNCATFKTESLKSAILTA